MVDADALPILPGKVPTRSCSVPTDSQLRLRTADIHISADALVRLERMAEAPLWIMCIKRVTLYLVFAGISDTRYSVARN